MYDVVGRPHPHIFCMGNTIMTSVIYVVSVKIILITNTWTIFNHIGLYVSIFFWYLFLVVYTLIPDNQLISNNYLYWSVYDCMSTAVFWLAPLVTAAACNVPDLAYKYVRRTYFPSADVIVSELDKLETKNHKSGARRLVERSLLKPVQHFKARKKAHTGFAFSQAEGSRDLMYSLGLVPLPPGALDKEAQKKKHDADDVSSSDSDSDSDLSSEEEHGKQRETADKEEARDD